MLLYERFFASRCEKINICVGDTSTLLLRHLGIVSDIVNLNSAASDSVHENECEVLLRLPVFPPEIIGCGV